MEAGFPWAAFLLGLCIVGYFGLRQKQKGAISSQHLVPGGKAKKGETDEKRPKDSAVKADPISANVFPPSTRPALQELYGHLPNATRKSLGNPAFNKPDWTENTIAFDEDYQRCDDAKYTCTGISIKEIKALGNFPDYATLSGVPLPQPYLEFDIDKALPRPYRPIRWVYHQTMSIHKLEPDWWLELERSYRSRLARRHAVFKEHTNDVFRFLPGSELACKELMEIALQFISTRYPRYFTLDTKAGVLKNRILGTTQNIYEKHPLLVLNDNIPEDFMVMMRNPETGRYHLRAALICLGIGFNAAKVIGKELREIHKPVPDYKTKMEFSMDRFFANVPSGKGIQRGSWGIDLDQRVYEQQDMPEFQHRFVQEPDLDPSRIFWRVDWQTLRRLPLSGACVFNFKSVFALITELRDEPYVPSIVLKVLKEGKQELVKYKGTWHAEHVAIPLLEQYEKEQVAKGIIEENWVVGTLPESPFFRGWEEKWHAQQGF